MGFHRKATIGLASVVCAFAIARCAGGVDVGHFGASDAANPFDVYRPDADSFDGPIVLADGPIDLDGPIGVGNDADTGSDGEVDADDGALGDASDVGTDQ